MIEPAERAAAVKDQREVRKIVTPKRFVFTKSGLIIGAVARSAGLVNLSAFDPGAYAPDFMLARAPRAVSYAPLVSQVYSCLNFWPMLAGMLRFLFKSSLNLLMSNAVQTTVASALS